MKRISLVFAGAVFGIACASTAAFAGSEKQKGPDPRIGEKVDRICFQQSINGWREADGHRRAVLLERGVNNWYFVKLSGACHARDFRFAQTIGIESRPAGGCLRRGDVILVRGGGDFVNRCHIRGIYQWDEDAEAPEDEEAA